MGISFQTADTFQPAIQDIGCEYLCIIAVAVHRTKSAISVNGINRIWDTLITEDLADPKRGLHSALSYYRTFDLVFDYLGLPNYHGDQVGRIRFGRVRYWSWVTNQHFNYAIRRMVTANGTRHSVLLNADLIEIYNPAPEYPGGKTTGIYLFHVDDHPLHTDTPF